MFVRAWVELGVRGDTYGDHLVTIMTTWSSRGQKEVRISPPPWPLGGHMRHKNFFINLTASNSEFINSLTVKKMVF